MAAIADDMTIISAREAASPEDADVVARALRHDMRWYDAGLADAPDEDVLDESATVRWPRRCVRRLNSVLLFAADNLVGLGTDFGWGEDLDRTRIAELVVLDGNADSYSIATALVSFLFMSALALRVRLGGKLSQLSTLGPALDVGAGLVFRHLARPKELLTVPTAEAPITPDMLRKLGAFGSGRLDAERPPSAAFPSPRLLASTGAHGQLIRGSRLLRGKFYPSGGRPRDLDVAIVGGGIAGLTAAHALAPRETTLFEREAVVGGTARSERGESSRFPLGAHYECDPTPNFGAEVLGLYGELGLTRRESDGRYTFVDSQHYVPPEMYEQSVLANGGTRRRGWRMFWADAAGAKARREILGLTERFPLPTRLATPSARALDRMTFAAWLREHQVDLPPDLAHGLDVLLRSDYAAPARAISAFAGLHYFLCRPYLGEGSRTFSPPEGLAYFAERLLERTPTVEVKHGHMVRRLTAHSDHVLLEVLDLAAQRLCTYRAQSVVYAAPKKALKWIYPHDAALFAGNAYAPWMTITFELATFRESEQLCWNNHVHDARPEHVGFTWVNHADREAPPVLTHYIAFEPGRWQHVRAFVADRVTLARECLAHVAAIVGRDVASLVKRVTVQTLGHAMAVPLPGKLFFDPNARRANPRVVYAGVDTGRLPLLAEAFDSGLEAARIIP